MATAPKTGGIHAPVTPSPELAAIHLVRGTGDLTAAMPRFVTAFIEAHLAG